MGRFRKVIVALFMLAFACLLWAVSTKGSGSKIVLDSSSSLTSKWQRYVERMIDERTLEWQSITYDQKVVNKTLSTPSVNSEWQQYVARVREERTSEWQDYVRMAVNKTMSQRLPNVIGIGVKKCGTGAVMTFLRHHPFVKVPKDVEIFFFNNRYKHGLDYYKKQMPPAADHEIVLEKTPAYFNTPPMELANRIHHDIPGVKLILILCEPVKRSFSDYIHEWARYNISKSPKEMAKYPTFDSYLETYIPRINKTLSIGKKAMIEQHMKQYYSDHVGTILTTGFYSLHLPRWMDLFSSKNLLIVNGEEMLGNPGFQVEKMQEFLDIPKLLLEEDFVRHPNTGKTKGRTRHSKGFFAATEENLENLKRLYTASNQELFEMTGIDYRNAEHSTQIE